MNIESHLRNPDISFLNVLSGFGDGAYLSRDIPSITSPRYCIDVCPRCAQLCVHIYHQLILSDIHIEEIWYIPASFPCINWNVPIFLLNCSLVWVYSNVRSRAACMILPSATIPLNPKRRRTYPSGPPLRTNLSRSNPDINTAAPPPTLPNTFSNSSAVFSSERRWTDHRVSRRCQRTTRQSGILSSIISSVPNRKSGLTPNLSRCSPTSNPLDDLSTRNAVRPLDAGPSVPVLA
jgi:hypothetical protein